MLHHLRTACAELTDEAIQANMTTGIVSVEMQRDQMKESAEQLEGFEVKAFRMQASQLPVALVGRDERTWQVGIRVEDQPPHTTRGALGAEVVPGVTIRRAAETDAAALRDIELAVPIVLGDTRVTYDRGEDYFAAERLMGDVVTLVIERDGIPAGLTSTVVKNIRADGQDIRGAYRHRLRLLPEARGQGIGQMLGFADFENNAWRVDFPYAFVAAENETMLRNQRTTGWSVRPERVVIDTTQHDGPTIGRPATPADSTRIVSLLNTAHEREALFVPYTERSLAVRLEREPELYSWRNFRLSDHAVAGVWPASLRVIRETTDGRSEDVRALVLDYGYEPRAEDELVALLRAECAALSNIAMTELAIFTSAPSGAYAQLTGLAKRTEPYLLFFAVPEPSDLARRGVYVDQLYF